MVSKPTEIVNFDAMIRTDRSYEHEQLRASKLEEIRRLSLARRGLTSQQASRPNKNT